MKKLFLLLTAMMLAFTSVQAQRVTDKLDRGLVAMKVSGGVFLSWRILGEEYYDVTYNVYRNGSKINSEPLTVSNFTDTSGTTSNTYTVAPVVKGKEQAQSKAVTPWTSSYKEIKLTHEGIASTLVPNDACCADVDGDGELEFLMKFDNASEAGQSYPKNGPTVNGKVTYEYSIFEVFKMDGKRLWWVNCGPNMGDFQNNEQNIVGYDWNQDGKAEVLMRLEEGSTIHMADGTTYTIGADGKNGTSWTNYRGATGGGTNWFMCVGREFLVYCNGETGQVFDIIDYPLARLETGETSLEKAWGDGYGHRASKFFFGAPYLDGRNPSIFLARGIYTQIKMCAFDVNKSTNKLMKRWDWRQTNGGFWMWQGYHNFGIADVDMDGRDEICYGSMVIDDNGKGLSTTGLGHGDAQHCGDFNPYIHGLEIYACNEDQPGNNYRDATTSKLYHRFESGNDDGRAMMDNFSDAYPGALGCSAREGAISSVYNDAIPGVGATGINTNFRIYWDGDLLSETFNYLNGKNTEGCVAKYGSWTPIYTAEGSMTNNDTKGTPSYQGDILGDWREEMVMRTASNNIRIYSTPEPTSYRMATLWADHQYRNAMVWQMCGYNQPPHVSYFTGELEGYTVAAPPLTMTGREEVKNGGTIGAALNGKHAIVCETGNTTVSMEDAITPDVLTFNVPSWVQGTAGTNYTAKEATINYDYYTCNVTGGSLAGSARLVKQGDGTLNLPKADFTHTGNTDFWEGTVNFDGTMKNSDLFLNRFVKLNSNGGQFKSIKAFYDATINPGGENNIGNITVNGNLYMDYGSRIVIDMDGDNHDVIKAGSMTLIKKTGEKWTKYGPKYVQPVIQVNGQNLKEGEYTIMEVGSLEGAILNFKIEGIETFKTGLRYEDGKVILSLGGTRGPSNVTWTGNVSTAWDKATTENFIVDGDESKTPDVFVNDDAVTFDDSAAKVVVNLNDEISVASVTFENNAKNYTLNGTGDIKAGALIKNGTGELTINTVNSYTGGNQLNGGTTIVSKLSNSVDPKGNLGGVVSKVNQFAMSNGAILQNDVKVTNGSRITMVGTEGGVINNSADFIQEGGVNGTKLTKTGSGWFKPTGGGAVAQFHLKQGVVDASSKFATKIYAYETTELRGNGCQTSAIEVTAGAKAKLYTVNRYNTNLALTGPGQLTAYCATEKGSTYYATRTAIQLNMANFTGTLVPQAVYAADGRFTFDTANGGTSGTTAWTLNIPAGIIVQNTGKALSVGNLTGSGVLGGGCAFSNGVTVPANTWNVGNEKDFTFDGVFTSADKFNKVGTGTMKATGIWTSTGAVAVNAGALNISKACLGTGTLTVAAGALVYGNSTKTAGSANVLTNSKVTINGTLLPALSPTSTLTTYVLIFSGKNLTIGTGGTLMFNASKAVAATSGNTTVSCSTIQDVNLLTINGTVLVNIMPGSTSTAWKPAVGDMLRLWNKDKITTFSGTPKVKAASNNGMAYELDSSRISEGIVSISAMARLGDVNGDGFVNMADANMLANYVMGKAPQGFVTLAADVNQDGVINMADAKAIVNLFLGL